MINHTTPQDTGELVDSPIYSCDTTVSARIVDSKEVRLKTLITIAHQDDEFFIASRISYELSQGHQFDIVYMTNGDGDGSIASLREAESISALNFLGILPSQIHFLGTEFNFSDGNLFKMMPVAFIKLCEKLNGQHFDQVYLPAWEGGHPDHDACHLIGVRFAQQNSISTVREFSLYNGFQTKYLRVSCLIPREGGALICRTLTLKEAFAAFALIRFYKSQLKTWFALALPAAISILFLRRECLREVIINDCSSRPHPGPLLYEKAFRVTYPDLESEARHFNNSMSEIQLK